MMRIVLCCATHRGYRVLQQLHKLAPECELVVFSFREDPWEPPFMDSTRDLTLSLGGQFFESRKLTPPALEQFWESTPVDLLLSVSWRYMIPAHIYRRARLGAYVLHDSMLPLYRGFSPTVWAMINGEKTTGASLFEMADAVDAGDIVDQQSIPIGDNEAITAILARVTETYLTLLERNLHNLITGTARGIPQDHARASYTCKRRLTDNEIDWSLSATQIHNLVRAVSSPYPGAFTYHNGQILRVWSASRITPSRRYIGAIPGRIVEVQPGKGTVILTGQGELLLGNVQYEKSAPTRADLLLNKIGQSLGRQH